MVMLLLSLFLLDSCFSTRNWLCLPWTLPKTSNSHDSSEVLADVAIARVLLTVLVVYAVSCLFSIRPLSGCWAFSFDKLSKTASLSTDSFSHCVLDPRAYTVQINTIANTTQRSAKAGEEVQLDWEVTRLRPSLEIISRWYAASWRLAYLNKRRVVQRRFWALHFRKNADRIKRIRTTNNLSVSTAVNC